MARTKEVPQPHHSKAGLDGPYGSDRAYGETELETIKRKYRFFQKLLEDTLGLEKGSLVVEEKMDGTAERMGKHMIERSGPG